MRLRCRLRRRSEGNRDSGSAAVEFLASVVLLTLLMVASIEIGLYVYVRNIAQAAAVEATRYGAPLGRGEGAARARIEELVPEVLGGYARGLRIRAGRTGEFLYVVIEGRVTPSAPLLPELPLRVEARAYLEEEAMRR